MTYPKNYYIVDIAEKEGEILSNNIVKYNNRLNAIPFRKFNTREMNLFFAIASKVRDHGSDEVVLSFNTLKQLSKYTQHGEAFVQDLNRTYHKLLSLNATTDDGDTIEAFVLFNGYKISRSEELVRISVNPKFKGIFNELQNWTRFSLDNFASIRSTYAKTMFRQIKGWRTVGTHEFSMEEFRKILDIPDYYRPSEIDRRVLKPIKEELAPYIRGIDYKKKHGGRGGKVTGYVFSWKPEQNNADDFSKGEIWDRKIGLDNIQNNNSLTNVEKDRATDKFLGLPLGTTEKKRIKKVIKATETDTLNDLRNMLKH